MLRFCRYMNRDSNKKKRIDRDISIMELLFVVLLLTACTMTSSTNTLSPSCQANCGDIDIPYPFGIGDGCYAKEYGDFNITCASNGTGYLSSSNIVILNISIAGQLRIESDTGYNCYQGGTNTSQFLPWVILGDLPLTFSHTRNKFRVIGCDTYAYINGEQGVRYSGGCISYCENPESFQGLPDGSCSGLGCCEVSIPRGLKRFSTQMNSYHNYTISESFNRCGYISLAEEGAYRFNLSDLSTDRLQTQTLPLVLDWSISNLTCAKAKNTTAVPYACRSDNSRCVESNNGIGYLCSCSDGYEGNPYLPGGCEGT